MLRRWIAAAALLALACLGGMASRLSVGGGEPGLDASADVTAIVPAAPRQTQIARRNDAPTPRVPFATGWLALATNTASVATPALLGYVAAADAPPLFISALGSDRTSRGPPSSTIRV